MTRKGKKLDYFDVQQINEIIKTLENAAKNADEASKTYSNDPISQRNFEVGYLNGINKTAAEILKDIMK